MHARLLLFATCSLLSVACTSQPDQPDTDDGALPGGGLPQAGNAAAPMPAPIAGSMAAPDPAAMPDPPAMPDPLAMPDPSTMPDPAVMPDPAMMPEPPAGPYEPFGTGADALVWRTDTFMLEGGQEQYLCFTKTLDEDLVINAYANEVDSFVHHLIFARVSAPEPEGFAECDVAFRNSWETLFISGTGNSKLEFPDDAGHQIAKGTQLLVQMHLLNAAAEPVEGEVTIHMRRSAMANPRPVNSFILGTAAVELPAGKTSDVVGTCAPFQSIQFIAGFPHMHKLGTRMVVEVGDSEATLQEVFRRDPFDFNDQRIDPVDVAIAAGQTTRVTCTFNNTHPETVMYGESTNNEMCYFVGFAVDQPSMSACLEVLPPFIFGG